MTALHLGIVDTLLVAGSPDVNPVAARADVRAWLRS
jgi:hypothetical protein